MCRLGCLCQEISQMVTDSVLSGLGGEGEGVARGISPPCTPFLRGSFLSAPKELTDQP